MRQLYWSAFNNAAHTVGEPCEKQVERTQNTLEGHWENENEKVDQRT